MNSATIGQQTRIQEFLENIARTGIEVTTAPTKIGPYLDNFQGIGPAPTFECEGETVTLTVRTVCKHEDPELHIYWIFGKDQSEKERALWLKEENKYGDAKVTYCRMKTNEGLIDALARMTLHHPEHDDQFKKLNKKLKE